MQAIAPPPLDSKSKGGEGTPASLFGDEVKEFSIFRNPIGNKGVMALAQALDAGGLSKLEKLNLSGSALAVAEAGGMLQDGIGDEGIAALASILTRHMPVGATPGMLSSLTDLRLFGNFISDNGLQALVEALVRRPLICRNLERLSLQNNLITDRSVIHMVDNLFTGGMINLHRLLLACNKIGNRGIEKMAQRLGEGFCGSLKKLSVAQNSFTAKGRTSLHEQLLRRKTRPNASVIEVDIFPLTESNTGPSLVQKTVVSAFKRAMTMRLENSTMPSAT